MTLFRTIAAGTIVLSTASLSLGHAHAEDRRVKIVNNTGFQIVKFQASTADTNDWEEDILGADVLASGDSVFVNIDDGSDACDYDFLATFEDGDTVEERGIDVCQISSFTFNE